MTAIEWEMQMRWEEKVTSDVLKIVADILTLGKWILKCIRGLQEK